MPILAGILSAVFFKVFDFLIARLTFNVAFSLAIVAVTGASLVALKVAYTGICVGLAASMPSAVTQGFNLVFPSNLPACLTVILLADITAVAWDSWKLITGYVVAAVKA